jgi:hypothetical protein
MPDLGYRLWVCKAVLSLFCYLEYIVGHSRYVVNQQCCFTFTILCFTVIDDENPTVYTAGALVTVTVTLVRQNMSVLFESDSVTERHEQQDVSCFSKGDEDEEDDKREELVSVVQLCASVMRNYSLICPVDI